VIKQSMNTGTFYDIKFLVFSRRSSSGYIDAPQAVYANSAILLAASPYCTKLVTAGFQESRIVDINQPPPSDWSHLETYDYDDDSDFEDEEQHDAEESTSTSDSVVTSESIERDGILESLDAVESPPSPTRNLGRMILISNAAYLTWNAFIFYLMTGQVAFRPLRSGDLPRAPEKDWDFPACSPKSMYRLADIVGASELKKEALANIRSQMSPKTSLTELFCNFTSRYTEVHAMWLEHACTLKEGHGSHLATFVKDFTSNMPPHYSFTLEAFVSKLLARYNPPSPPPRTTNRNRKYLIVG